MQEALFGFDEPQPPVGTWVYAIGAEGSPIVKIGFTANLAKRLGGIQNGNPNRLVIRWKTPGDRDLEKWLHAKFQHHRASGEWFDFRNQDPIVAIQEAVAAIGAPEIADEVNLNTANETASPGMTDEVEPQGPFYSPNPATEDPDHNNPDYAPHWKNGCRYLTPAELTKAGLRMIDNNFWCFCDFPGHYCMLNLT